MYHTPKIASYAYVPEAYFLPGGKQEGNKINRFLARHFVVEGMAQALLIKNAYSAHNQCKHFVEHGM